LIGYGSGKSFNQASLNVNPNTQQTFTYWSKIINQLGRTEDE
jgi:hypothetical protein